jgi:NADH:ubiquinone oxidoreductase subunit 4 (subunit M)
MSVLLLLLTTFITPIAILSTWSAIEERVMAGSIPMLLAILWMGIHHGIFPFQT